jgi:hypothetical protein
MEMGEVLSVLNRKVRKQLSIHYHEYWPKPIAQSQQGAINYAKEDVAKLVQVVI